MATSLLESGPVEAPRSFVEDEVARLEKLLSARARETSALSRELERRSGLLREALERLSSTAAAEIDGLRVARDAAVQRAIDAELGRAELAFQLDETRSALQASASAAPAGPVGELRGLYSRIAQLEEADDAQRARLLLAEQDRELARSSILELERQLVEEGERFELSLLRARAEASSLIAESAVRATAELSDVEARAEQRLLRVQTRASAQLAEAEANAAARLAAAETQATAAAGSAAPHTTELALRGERDGLLARMRESETALRSVRERALQSDRLRESHSEKLAEARAEAAELAVACQARNARISEFGVELAREQHEVRAARAQLAAALAAQQSERQARDSDVQIWMERLREVEANRERDAHDNAEANHAPTPHWARDLVAFLAGLREPLVQLKAALDDPGEHAQALVAQAGAADDTLPGTDHDAEVLAALEEKLRVSEARSAELEAMLSGRKRDSGISALKGELIDTRADAARLSDDLVKERTRRRRLVVTVRALQAAFESGEAPGPWVEELIVLLNEGASVPPFHG